MYDRVWATILHENSNYDKKVADLVTDYVYLVKNLIQLSETLSRYSGLSEINASAIINKVLNEQARSRSRTGEQKTYKDLIENRFNIVELISIEPAAENETVSEYDYSRVTINQSKESGYQKGLEASIREPINRDMLATICLT